MATVTKAKESGNTLQSPQMDVKKAVAIAMESFRDLFPEEAKAHLKLEEIEESGDSKHWLITLGYDTGVQRRLAFEFGLARSYKTLTIDQASGRVLSVKIRSVA